MRLIITVQEDGEKNTNGIRYASDYEITRIIKLNNPDGGYLGGIEIIIRDMIESLNESKKPL